MGREGEGAMERGEGPPGACCWAPVVTLSSVCPADSLITLVMSEAIHVDLRMLRSFRVLRPLKLVSRVPSECSPVPAPHLAMPGGLSERAGEREARGAAAAGRQAARAACTAGLVPSGLVPTARARTMGARCAARGRQLLGPL